MPQRFMWPQRLVITWTNHGLTLQCVMSTKRQNVCTCSPITYTIVYSRPSFVQKMSKFWCSVIPEIYVLISSNKSKTANHEPWPLGKKLVTKVYIFQLHNLDGSKHPKNLMCGANTVFFFFFLKSPKFGFFIFCSNFEWTKLNTLNKSEQPIKSIFMITHHRVNS